MTFKEVAFTVYPVSDVKRARDFYTNVLGLRETANWEDKWIEFDIGSSTFAISDGFAQLSPGAKGGMIAFELDDFAGCLRELETKGVKPAMGPFDGSLCLSATIVDPDGNELILHQRKTGA